MSEDVKCTILFIFLPLKEIVWEPVNKWETNVRTNNLLYLEGGSIFPTKF
jgi:hypothetical protein